MLCREAQEEFVALIDDELDPKTSDLVRAHIHACADCRSEWEETLQLFSMARATVSDECEVPADLGERIWEAVSAGLPAGPARRMFSGPLWYVGVAAAAVLFMAGASFIIIPQWLKPREQFSVAKAPAEELPHVMAPNPAEPVRPPQQERPISELPTGFETPQAVTTPNAPPDTSAQDIVSNGLATRPVAKVEELPAVKPAAVAPPKPARSKQPQQEPAAGGWAVTNMTATALRKADGPSASHDAHTKATPERVHPKKNPSASDIIDLNLSRKEASLPVPSAQETPKAEAPPDSKSSEPNPATLPAPPLVESSPGQDSNPAQIDPSTPSFEGPRVLAKADKPEGRKKHKFQLWPIQTYGSAAPPGALAKRDAGAIIGNRSDHAKQGALIGAVAGGATGLIVKDVMVNAQKKRDAQAAAAAHQYQVAEGQRIYAENAQVLPNPVQPGSQVNASMQYSVLGTGSGAPVTEVRTLQHDGKTVATVSDKTFQRTDGTWESACAFTVPPNAEPGTYTLMHTIKVTGDTRESTCTCTFTVSPHGGPLNAEPSADKAWQTMETMSKTSEEKDAALPVKR